MYNSADEELNSEQGGGRILTHYQLSWFIRHQVGFFCYRRSINSHVGIKCTCRTRLNHFNASIKTLVLFEKEKQIHLFKVTLAVSSLDGGFFISLFLFYLVSVSHVYSTSQSLSNLNLTSTAFFTFIIVTNLKF